MSLWSKIFSVFKTVLLSFLLPAAFLLDLLIYLGAKNDCINCGWEEIVEKGIYSKIVLNKIKRIN